MRAIFCLRQGPDEPTEKYYRRFESSIATDELAQCIYGTPELNKTYTGGDDDDGTRRFQAMCLIMSADPKRFSVLWNDLKNSTLLGTDIYPKTPTAAYDVLCRYKKPTPPEPQTPIGAVTFLQNGETNNTRAVPGNYDCLFTDITYY